MKKFVLAILAALAFTGVQAQAFPDIPANHWAGEAVQRIADLGIVIGFPDGTYRGNEGFTRYQAALVISRLLDVIRADMDAMKALTDADIASLRNALQELASDVAAQDVRLSAVEGAVASISDDVASNTARIEALEAASGQGMIDPAVLQDLQNQIDAANVAADTAQSTADAALAAAQAAQDQSAQNAAAIDAINDLLALLNADVEDLKANSGVVDLSGIQGQVDRNTADIANIREFVILLRRDQVALRDRVAALEASDAAQQAAIDDLTARVTKIEEDLFTISGSIELSYRIDRLSGDDVPMDVDRVWGLNNNRNTGASVFSSGEDDTDGDDDADEAGERTQDRQDIEQTADGDEFSTTVTLNVGFGTGRNGTGDPNALNSFESVITLTLVQTDGVEADCDNDDTTEDETCPLVNTDGDTIDFPFVFAVDDFTTTFDPIGAAPLTFQYGESPSGAFTPYIFDSAGPGYVATVGSPDFLAFLNPTLQVAYGAVDDDSYEDGTYDYGYYRGIRGTLSPLQGETLSATGGFSFAQGAVAAGEEGNADDNNQEVTVWGLDGQVGISVVDLNFEYANQSGSITHDSDADTDGVQASTIGGDASLIYVTADVDVASLGIPVLKSLNANYRMIPDNWFGLTTNSDDQPFENDQSGFGVKASLGLFILDPVDIYFDSYSVEAPEAVNVTAFGADATINLFSAFSITGFFHSVSVDGEAADSAEEPFNGEEVAIVDVADDSVERDDNGYDTGFGVALKHDGASENALIPNLNLSVGYSQTEADFSKSTIDIDADYLLTISILTLDPYAGFEIVNDGDDLSDDTTTIEVGTGVKTEALGIIFKPSFDASVNFRTTSHADVTGGDYTATELQWGVGLSLNEFLTANSVLRARYGSWTGENITLSKNAVDADDAVVTDGATNVSDGDSNNGSTQSTSGLEVSWTYYDLSFGYGVYTTTISGAPATTPEEDNAVNGTTVGQAFKISYKVNF